MPERFTGGDFTAWLRHFDRCAAANAWNADTRLLKLPAFLHGPAAAYFDSLAQEEKDTLTHLLGSLKKCFTLAVGREQFYREFEQQALRPAKDPSLYLWRFKDLLRNAEPELSNDAFDALLRRQFMKGLPISIRMKLLESDPTPNLAPMVSFTQRYHALDELPVGPTASCAAVHHAAVDHTVCDKRVNNIEKAVPCYHCQSFIHIRKCSGLTEKEFFNLGADAKQWLCSSCHDDTFPFNSIKDTQYILSSNFNSKEL